MPNSALSDHCSTESRLRHQFLTARKLDASSERHRDAALEVGGEEHAEVAVGVKLGGDDFPYLEEAAVFADETDFHFVIDATTSSEEVAALVLAALDGEESSRVA